MGASGIPQGASGIPMGASGIPVSASKRQWDPNGRPVGFLRYQVQLLGARRIPLGAHLDFLEGQKVREKYLRRFRPPMDSTWILFGRAKSVIGIAKN